MLPKHKRFHSHQELGLKCEYCRSCKNDAEYEISFDDETHRRLYYYYCNAHKNFFVTQQLEFAGEAVTVELISQDN